MSLFANTTHFRCQVSKTAASKTHSFILMIKCYLSNTSILLRKNNIYHRQPFKYLYNKYSITKRLINSIKPYENIIQHSIIHIRYNDYAHIKHSKQNLHIYQILYNIYKLDIKYAICFILGF